MINYPFPYEITMPYNTGAFLGYLTDYEAIENLIRSQPSLAHLKRQYFSKTGAQARPSSSSRRTPRESVGAVLKPNKDFCEDTVHQIRSNLDTRNRAGSQPPAERPVPKARPKAVLLRPPPPPIPDHLLPPPPPPPEEERPPPLRRQAHPDEDQREEAEKEATNRKMEEEIEKKRKENDTPTLKN